MKVEISKIPLEGAVIEEERDAASLDLITEEIKFRKPVRIRAQLYKITNALTAQVTVDTVLYSICSRCLKEVDIPFHKELRLNYQIGKREPYVDLGQDIREEVILDYPLKTLCNPGCKGLCIRCGKSLNDGKCAC